MQCYYTPMGCTNILEVTQLLTISLQYTLKEQLKKHTILADIMVSTADIPNLTTADMIKIGAAFTVPLLPNPCWLEMWILKESRRELVTLFQSLGVLVP